LQATQTGLLQGGAAAELAPPLAFVVLDSNAVLEALAFQDPRMQPLWTAVTRREVNLLASPYMRLELAQVLQREMFQRRAWSTMGILAAYDQNARGVPDAAGSAPALRCRDKDDQAFLDVALAHHARWLVTRDKDLLSLARRADKLGLAILRPEHWVP
jgi:uncharacterized protein